MTSTREKYRGDPQVQFHSDVLRAAVEASGLTATALADRVDTSRQLMEHMMTGAKVRRARRSRMRKVARALGLNLDQLLITPDAMRAAITRGGPDRPAGYEHQYSTRTAFATWGFIERCLASCRHDLAARTYPEWPERAIYDDQALLTLRLAMAGLIQLAPWRDRMIVWDDPREAQRRRLEPGPASDSPSVTIVNARADDPKHEQTMLDLVAIYSHVLRPWLEDGGASLNYRWVWEESLAQERRVWAPLGMGVPRPRITPKPAFIERRVTADNPYALLGWK